MTEPQSDYVTLQYEGPAVNPETGEPYRWRHIVSRERAGIWRADAETRWPGCRVTITAAPRKRDDDDI